MTGRKVLGKPVVREFIIPGYPIKWAAGVIRTGRTRVSAWCQHNHRFESTAMRCAEKLAGL